jgi:hypothetical protein
MPETQKALQARQTRPIARGGIVTSKLLAEEIHTDFCHHPLTQRTVTPVLPPRRLPGLMFPLVGLRCLLRAVHRLAHRQADGAAFLFQ